MKLSLDQAEHVIRAAQAHATQLGVAAAIAVLDTGGHLKAFVRMDGAWLGAIDVAIRKARTSVLFEASTEQIGEVCKPDAEAHGLDLTNDGLVTFGGGLPLQDTQGVLRGAVGVSGGHVGQDKAIAAQAQRAWHEPCTSPAGDRIHGEP